VIVEECPTGADVRPKRISRFPFLKMLFRLTVMCILANH
jgi:hypothetical protein